MRSSSYSRGLFAEFLARNYLRCRGFKILQTRYITGRNTNRAEIDIIARRRNLIIFVEVKFRSDLNTALDAVTPRQATRLYRAATTYLGRTGWAGDARFDIIAVYGWRLRWIKNAI